MKKTIIITITLVGVLLSLAVPVLAETPTTFDGQYAPLTPDYIKATYPNLSFSTYLDCPNIFAMPAGNGLTNNVELTSYGSTSPRVLYHSTLRQMITSRLDISATYAGNSVLGTSTVKYSAIQGADGYFDDAWDIFPLENSQAGTRYSSPFNDDVTLEYSYSNFYVDLGASLMEGLSRPYIQVYVNDVNNAYSDPESWEQLLAELRIEYPLLVDYTALTASGVSASTMGLIPRVSSVTPTGSQTYAVMLTYDLYGDFYRHAKNAEGLVVSDGLATFPSVKCRIDSTMSTYARNLGVTGYLLGYQVAIFDQSTFTPVLEGFHYENNVTLYPFDFADWFLTPVRTFLGTDIIPMISIGGLLAVAISAMVAVWILKLFAGG